MDVEDLAKLIRTMGETMVAEWEWDEANERDIYNILGAIRQYEAQLAELRELVLAGD